MESIEDKIQNFFIENQLTLCLAESCTGGGVSFRLVQKPNCSRYLLGSIVSYSRAAKENCLDVLPHTLATFGEVSSEVAQEMALGALKKFNANFALSITGIAGPSGGSQLKPVGTVFFALASNQGKALSWKQIFIGTRNEIIAQSIDTALLYLWKYSRLSLK